MNVFMPESILSTTWMTNPLPMFVTKKMTRLNRIKNNLTAYGNSGTVIISSSHVTLELVEEFMVYQFVRLSGRKSKAPTLIHLLKVNSLRHWLKQITCFLYFLFGVTLIVVNHQMQMSEEFMTAKKWIISTLLPPLFLTLVLLSIAQSLWFVLSTSNRIYTVSPPHHHIDSSQIQGTKPFSFQPG